MVKISLAELEQAIQLIKRTSTDMHISVRQSQSEAIALGFMNVDGQLVTIELWDESTRNFAKVHSTERLGEVLGKVRK